MKNIAIIGGGPSGLMLACSLDPKKYHVTIYDKKKTVGRKFLVAGEGGFNLTYQASEKKLIDKYYPKDFIEPFIKNFTNQDLITWLEELGIPTFVGSSNRVFPQKGIKPIDVLSAIISRAKDKGVEFSSQMNWIGFTENNDLLFENNTIINSDIVVFAMGGASWKITGSDGHWANAFKENGIDFKTFQSANCAFQIKWKDDFIKHHEGKPLKNIALCLGNHFSKGELVISKFGLEGNAIYALSNVIQDSLLKKDSCALYLDLKPTLSTEKLLIKFKKSSYKKTTDILKNDLNLDRTAIALIKEYSSKDTYENPEELVKIIKALPLQIISAGPLDEAISTLGGISLSEIDENLELKKLPNCFAVGEMLDWFAPTGGYLLQGSFSMAYSLAKHLNNKLRL